MSEPQLKEAPNEAEKNEQNNDSQLSVPKIQISPVATKRKQSPNQDTPNSESSHAIDTASDEDKKELKNQKPFKDRRPSMTIKVPEKQAKAPIGITPSKTVNVTSPLASALLSSAKKRLDSYRDEPSQVVHFSSSLQKDKGKHNPHPYVPDIPIPKVCSKITDFAANYEIIKGGEVIQTDYYEIRKARSLRTSARHDEIRMVKIYRKREFQSNWPQCIKREITLFKTFDHPSIVHLHEDLEDEKNVYLVFENLDGATLQNHIMIQGSLSEEETVQIGNSVFSLMRYLHKKGIIIRQLLPDYLIFKNQDNSEPRLIQCVHLMFANYVTNIKSEESEDFLEKLNDGPKNSFLGKVIYDTGFDHRFTAPESLPKPVKFDPFGKNKRRESVLFDDESSDISNDNDGQFKQNWYQRNDKWYKQHIKIHGLEDKEEKEKSKRKSKKSKKEKESKGEKEEILPKREYQMQGAKTDQVEESSVEKAVTKELDIEKEGDIDNKSQQENEKPPEQANAPIVDPLANMPRTFGYASDIWNFGCLIFNIFTGVQPFYAPSKIEMFDLIRQGKWLENVPDPYYFQEQATAWETVKIASDGLRTLLTQIFVVDPKNRISTSDMLFHLFFKREFDKYKSIGKQRLNEIFLNIKNFRMQPGFHEEALRMTVRKFLSLRERTLIRDIFEALDAERIGEMDPQDMIHGFKHKFNMTMTQHQWQSAIKIMTQDKETVTYTDFMVAAAKKHSLMMEENLIQSFNQFDTDQDNRIDENDLFEFSTFTDRKEFQKSVLFKSYVHIINDALAEQEKTYKSLTVELQNAVAMRDKRIAQENNMNPLEREPVDKENEEKSVAYIQNLEVQLKVIENDRKNSKGMSRWIFKHMLMSLIIDGDNKVGAQGAINQNANASSSGPKDAYSSGQPNVQMSVIRQSSDSKQIQEETYGSNSSQRQLNSKRRNSNAGSQASQRQSAGSKKTDTKKKPTEFLTSQPSEPTIKVQDSIPSKAASRQSLDIIGVAPS